MFAERFDWDALRAAPRADSAATRPSEALNEYLDGNPDEVFLSAYFEAPPGTLSIEGYGERQLRVGTRDAECRNRRAVVRGITRWPGNSGCRADRSAGRQAA